MKIQINRSKIIFVIYMIFVLNVTHSIFYSNSARALQIPLAMLGLFYMFVADKGFGKIRVKSINEFNAFCTPMIVITMISVYTSIAVYHTTNPSDWKQSIMRCFYYVVPFLTAYYSVRKFRNDTPRLLIISGLISYSTVFIRYIYYGGFGILLHFSNNKVNGISLEVHNLTYCMGLFFLYYLLSDKYDKKFKTKICLILMLGIFFGDKRALYLGLAVTLLVYFLFHKFKEKRLTLLKIIFSFYIAAAFGYLILIKTGVFEALLYKYGINDMSRLTFWNYFSSTYEISPFYWGRGIAYTDNIMSATKTMREMHVTAATNIHNDILRAYIGWGCLPMLYYLVNFFLLRVNRFIKDKNEENGWRYFAIASLYLFINFFDNMLSAENFNLCFFVVYLLLVNDLESKNDSAEISA
ncbi:O-antigen ligase family protein [Blautia sp. LMAG:89]|uniref:O-antigen ligase family protein n=1 Tax=Blautia sp. LMAG:89 TaxID=1969173 RepID=UPI002579C019|nr:O-antigen ligase family protein [Blautia sp. LMAG:89]